MTLERNCAYKNMLGRSKEKDVIHLGILRKLKNNKIRFYVLHAASKDGRARLECFQSEKKFKDSSTPSRTIFISEIFSIDKTKDAANDFSFTVFLKDEKLSLIAEFPDDRDCWIEALDFARKQQMAMPSGSTYEFVWDISIKEEGIAKGTSLIGDGRLAKNGTSLVFMKRTSDDVIEEICLSSVRRSGQADSFLLLEIGRSHPIGPGELWIETQDSRTAENMYAVIFGSNVVRPKSYMFTERSRTSSHSMTNRRKSDGADKAKPGKRSFLPFLRSKLKDTDAYAEKNFSLKSKRSHSAADIRKLGVNSNDDSYAKLLLAHQQSSPASNSTTDVRRDLTAKRKEKSKRKSLFRSKKQELSKSVQDLHTIYADTGGRLPRENRVSVLKTQYEMSVSLSAQNIASFGQDSPASSPSSSRLANIKKLSQMNAKSSLTSSSSTSNIPGEINRRKMANGRPVTMAFDALADNQKSSLLRNTRWKSLDNDLKGSPAVSSEDCSSADSSHSYDSLNGLQIAPTRDDSLRSRRSLADEGYVRMNYNYDEEKPYANLHDPKSNNRHRDNNDSKTNSVYMWISPDAGMPNEEPEGQESYMDMSPVKSLDFSEIRKKFSEQTEKADENQNTERKSSAVYTLIGPATNADEPNTFKVQDERHSDDGEQPTVPLAPRYKREISTQSTTSSDSKITRYGPASVSSADGEDDDKPVPLPRKSKREKSVPNIEDRRSLNDDNANDESPPLPPKCNRQLSYQRSFSDEEKTTISSSSAGRQKVSPQNSSCNVNRPVPLPPNYHREVSESSSQSDEERRGQNSPTPAAIVGRPLPTLPRSQGEENSNERNRHSASYSPEKMKGRPVPLPPGSNSAESRAQSRGEPPALNKVRRSLSAQNSAPLPTKYQRKTSEQTVKSGQEYFEILTSKDRRQSSPRSSTSDEEKPLPAREHRALSARSPAEDEVFTTTPTSPEKRSLWKDLGKRMTVNFKQRKTAAAAARARQSEACRSHFYVDTCPIPDQRNVSPPTETTQSHPYEERERADQCGLSEGDESPIRKQETRPNSLNLNLRPKSSAEQREVCDNRDTAKENIYTTVDANYIENDTNSTHSVRKDSPTQGSEYSSVLQTKTNQDFDRTKQVYSRVGHSYETVYTEVTLKDKHSDNMPIIKSLKRVKKKSKDLEVDETIQEIRPQDFGETDDSQIPERKFSQKIVSSPTKDPKGYENISLRDGIITTPLDEVEGRPYMNLGFHKGKGKHEGKKSGDEAALQLLMNLQTEKKIGDEITARRQSRGEVFTPPSPKGINETIKLLPDDVEEEVSYVNVGKDHQLVDNKGRRVLQSTESEDGHDYMNLGRHASERSTDGEDEAYQNLFFQHGQARKGSDFASDDLQSHAESPDYANIRSNIRQSPSTKAKSNVENVYTHIGAQDANDTKQISPINERRKERPVPKPRAKKPERRKISQEPTSKSKNPYDHVDISPKNNRTKNGVPTPGPFDAYDISEPSYINVGSYHDEFDVSNVGSKMPAAKSRSYENLADEFVPRRYRKKSQEYGLEYADVELVGFKCSDNGRHDTEDDDRKHAELAAEKPDQNSPISSSKQSPTTKQKGSPRSRGGCAYTEVDFMKSQGITEAMRNRRTESSDDIGRDGPV